MTHLTPADLDPKRLRDFRDNLGQYIVREIPDLTITVKDALWLHALARLAVGPMQGEPSDLPNTADIDRVMMEQSEMYVQGRFAQMVLQDVGKDSKAYYDAAQLRASFRAGYDFANRTSARATGIALDTSTTPASVEQSEAKEWRENVEAMLSTGDPDVVRCHEGGGPESLVGSLVLTMMRTRNSRDKALASPTPTKPAAVTAGVVTDAATELAAKAMHDEAPLIMDGGVLWGDLGATWKATYRKLARAALSTQPQAVNVPEGWVLAPKEPTEAMVRAAMPLDLSYMPDHQGPDRAAVYRAMIAASPTHQPMNALDQPGSEEGGVR